MSENIAKSFREGGVTFLGSETLCEILLLPGVCGKANEATSRRVGRGDGATEA